MEKNKPKVPSDWDFVDFILVLGVITLSLNHVDGWGWLIFILLIKHW
jgi:hypothetical protein